jgi:hypothetical protein
LVESWLCVASMSCVSSVTTTSPVTCVRLNKTSALFSTPRRTATFSMLAPAKPCAVTSNL